MYEQLIPAVIQRFAISGESERAFLLRVQEADQRLRSNYSRSSAIASDLYGDPVVRAAYLLRYFGHYTLQIGDLLRDLEGSSAGSVFAAPELRLAALCGGPCPEAIAVATLHQQAGGRSLAVNVLDRQAQAWADCWPITTRIIDSYPGHPRVEIGGMGIDLLHPRLSPLERKVLERAQVLTMMNCLNELVGLDPARVRRGFAIRLDALASGTLVLASDQAGYAGCATGLWMLHELLAERGAELLVCELDPRRPHQAQNRFDLPDRIAWIYGQETNNLFRIHVKQLRLAALIH